MKLYTKITIGLVAGIAAGWGLNSWYNETPFAQADMDSDGKLNIIELTQVSEGRTAEYLNNGEVALYDIDKDGKINWADVVNGDQAKRKDEINVVFPLADLDKSGSLSYNEVKNKGHVFEYYTDKSVFNLADTSMDGALTLAEVMLVEFGNGPSGMQMRFDKTDSDRNKFLSIEEIVGSNNFPQFITEASYKKADLTSDGKLSMDEVGWAGIDLKRFVNKDLFPKADGNGDFMLSEKEDKAIFGGQRFTQYTDPVGRIFINLVKMVVVPLILASLVLGAANLGDIRKLGSMGLKAFGFFMLTTAVAVSIGVMAANVARPGDGLGEEKKQELLAQYQKTTDKKVESVTTGPKQSEFQKISDLIVNMVPTNPISALAKGDMLAIIFFALFAGLCLTLIPAEKGQPFIQVMDGLNEIVLKMVMLAMETAPYGVFALIVGVVADMGIDILLPLLKYGAVVVVGLLLHLTLTHGSFIFFYLKKNPIKYLSAIKEAILLGFSTSSSSATLPISMNVAQKNLGISNQVTSFVLPLGATINMDGTALYQGVAAIFIAQVYGIDLSFSDQLIMVLTATLASVGAAGVPGAGMITLAVVLGTAGIPVEGIALIFGLDRLLDMFRTTINIIGDITCAAVLAKSNGEAVDIYHDRDMIPG